MAAKRTLGHILEVHVLTHANWCAVLGCDGMLSTDTANIRSGHNSNTTTCLFVLCSYIQLQSVCTITAEV